MGVSKIPTCGGQRKLALPEKGNLSGDACLFKTISTTKEEVVKYLGFAKSVANSKGFRGIKPKYLTTAESSGIFKKIS
ncbi:MAG: hypothetical protein JRC68_03375 [Deltaproteobacteria bacterium]|nr:hypothetical protein [Deltaproteobacteria bacterium]